jgi:rhamnosyl/mannosyltransferase
MPTNSLAGRQALAQSSQSNGPQPVHGVARTMPERRPRVLHVGKYYPPHMGGIETHLQALCSQLLKSFDVQVMVANDGPTSVTETVEGVPVFRVPTSFTFASTPLCPSMVSRIKRTPCDIIHLHFPNPMAVLAYLASGTPARLVVTYHSDMVRQRILGPLFEPLLHAVLRQSDAIIATSPNYVQTSPVLARHLDRCHVVPLGIRTSDFAGCNPDLLSAVRRQYGERLILSTGRLVSYKGFEYLVRAMGHIDAKLLIVGKGPLQVELMQLAAELGVTDRVHLLGRVENDLLAACYHAAQVFVLPSVGRNEAFGLVQVEAMAAGLPVINTRLDSGVPYVSLHEQTGLTVPPRDSDALAAALNRLLDNSELRRSLGDAARARARAEFSLDSMTAATEALYEQVLAAGASRAKAC